MQSVVAALSAILLAACGSDDGGGNGPSRIDVAITVSTTEFTHSDGYAGQTPKQASTGIRSLTLIADSGEQWVLFDRVTSPVIVSYQSGARTLLGTVFSDHVVIGHFNRARLVFVWSRFEIAATLHEIGGATPGTLSVLHVTSDGTLIGAETKDAGYYLHDFAGGTKTGHWSGADASLREHITSAGVETKLENGEWASYFPVDLEIDSGDGMLTIDVNLHEAFRWQDLPEGENQPAVYDFAPPEYEPVMRFGANRFDVAFEAR